MTNQEYRLMPFLFKRILDTSRDELLLVNESGEYYFIALDNFELLISNALPRETSVFSDLKSRHFIASTDINQTINMVATKVRTKKRFLTTFTSLHMMVITLRCNHKCEYCQVSCEDQEAHKFDMTPNVCRQVVDYIFRSPSPIIKIEFQGGEPILNWPAITATIEYAETVNKAVGKILEFVICTNLTLVDQSKLDYLRRHHVNISTSLDGPSDLHDAKRRLRLGGSSYDLFKNKLHIARENMPSGGIDALMTFSAASLGRIKEIVDEYIQMGFQGIFLRSLNPYGFAAENAAKLGYPMEVFVNSYKECLEYIIQLNLAGNRFVEYYTALLLSRILTPFSTGFVDLQSPSGAGISGAIYDYNGDVYPADEARMLARMGDNKFLMGNVFEHSYGQIFNGAVLQELVNKSCLETLPGCSNCVYRPYCGADPIRNYLECKDLVGMRAGSNFCRKNKGIFDILFGYLKQNDDKVMDVFWSWITNRNIEDISNAEG